MDGALLVDKPEGPTSFDVIRTLRKLLDERRLGHSGTLDPFASGLLVVLAGRATRLQEVFLGARKRYTGTLLFGLATDSDDITGAAVAQLRIDDTDELAAKLAAVLRRFIGRISQVPPAYSAVKVEGRRSYARARAGEEVVLAPREVEIEAFELGAAARAPEGGVTVDFTVSCSKGTYVRALARDLGAAIEVPCCLAALRRTVSEPFLIEDAVPLSGLEIDADRERAFRPLSELLSHLPRIETSHSNCKLIRQGNQRAFREAIASTESWEGATRFAGIFDPAGELHGVAERCSASPDRDTAEFRIRCIL